MVRPYANGARRRDPSKANDTHTHTCTRKSRFTRNKGNTGKIYGIPRFGLACMRYVRATKTDGIWIHHSNSNVKRPTRTMSAGNRVGLAHNISRTFRCDQQHLRSAVRSFVSPALDMKRKIAERRVTSIRRCAFCADRMTAMAHNGKLVNFDVQSWITIQPNIFANEDLSVAHSKWITRIIRSKCAIERSG